MVGTPRANVACPPVLKWAKERIQICLMRMEHPPFMCLPELAENGDLYVSSDEWPRRRANSTTLIKPLVKALAYAYHRHGISHRDIKLENIFVMKDGTIKLGIGLAAFDTKIVNAQALVGHWVHGS